MKAAMSARARESYGLKVRVPSASLQPVEMPVEPSQRISLAWGVEDVTSEKRAESFLVGL